jgi:thioredoxin reductase (NADPH)
MDMIKDYELAIIGGGPAGLTAGIYAKRAGIKTVIFEEKIVGGQALNTTMIENYPGFDGISGADLMKRINDQARRYVDIKETESVENIKVNPKNILLTTTEGNYEVGAVILATGMEHKKVGIKGEVEFTGRGVSYCAVFDGTFFKGKKVAVIGGGNTAATEAVYLRQIGCDVYLVHRRDQLRAYQYMQEKMKSLNVNIILDSVVEEIYGEKSVKGVVIKNLKTNKITKLDASGVFIAIGETPKNELAKLAGVKLDERGYIITDRNMRTDVKRIYAAGDVTGGVRQIVTACAEGAMAALATTEVLGKQYPF